MSDQKPVVIADYDPRVNPLRHVHPDAKQLNGANGGYGPRVRIVAIPNTCTSSFPETFAYVVERAQEDAAGGIRWETDRDHHEETIARFVSDLRAQAHEMQSAMRHAGVFPVKIYTGNAARVIGELFTINAALEELGCVHVALGDRDDLRDIFTFIDGDRRFRVTMGNLDGGVDEWPMIGKYEIDVIDKCGKSVLREPIRAEHFTAKSLGKQVKT